MRCVRWHHDQAQANRRYQELAFSWNHDPRELKPSVQPDPTTRTHTVTQPPRARNVYPGRRACLFVGRLYVGLMIF